MADLALLEGAVNKLMEAKPAGLTQMRRVRGHSLYLHQIKVDEAHRRKGIGRELLRAFMTAGARAGATKMFLTTGAENTAARSCTTPWVAARPRRVLRSTAGSCSISSCCLAWIETR